MNRLIQRVALLAALGVSNSVVYGQLSSGSLSGQITDFAGATVPRAQVRVQNVDTGTARETQTDDSGFYQVPNLLPAVYELTVRAEGFKIAVRKGVQLQVNQGLRVDVQLELGDVRQRVEIAAEAPLLETESSKVGTVVETRQITELPLNGRQFAQLILLTPGALPLLWASRPLSRCSSARDRIRPSSTDRGAGITTSFWTGSRTTIRCSTATL